MHVKVISFNAIFVTLSQQVAFLNNACNSFFLGLSKAFCPSRIKNFYTHRATCVQFRIGLSITASVSPFTSPILPQNGLTVNKLQVQRPERLTSPSKSDFFELKIILMLCFSRKRRCLR